MVIYYHGTYFTIMIVQNTATNNHGISLPWYTMVFYLRWYNLQPQITMVFHYHGIPWYFCTMVHFTAANNHGISLPWYTMVFLPWYILQPQITMVFLYHGIP